MAYSTVSVAAALALLLASALYPAEASNFTAWEMAGCVGASHTYDVCGCHNLTHFGGYDFLYTEGQPLKFYCDYGCRPCEGSSNAGPTTVSHNDEYCGGFKFKSIELPCVAAAHLLLGPAKIALLFQVLLVSSVLKNLF